MKKYWYEEGMCRTLGYKGQYPVTYTSTDGLIYNRECMCCTAVINGTCKIHQSCEILLTAPASMENNWQLRDKKIG